ncbi:iron-sulfur cluster assembly 2 homolog, mitochondrial-like [Haliotis asinina]|uniref:iron-sulfur cluster assembly 2 homolog, mitochondrial-like n=1 Tax=Haliotis asinina TaxID=109174 RepID=UPI0035319F91
MASVIRNSTQVITVARRVVSWSVRRQQNFQQNTRTVSGSNLKTASDGEGLKLSDSCVKQLKKLSESEATCLRVIVEGGGCSGFQYKFQLDSNMVEGEDRVFERDGVRVVVDEDSMEFLSGSTVDYHEELIRSAFRIINNPKAEQGCSCGASFAFKL